MPHPQEAMSSALVPTNADLAHAVTVSGVKVSYKKPRKDYPVSIRIIIGDEVTIKSQKYDKSQQEFLWGLNKQFSPDAKFTVVVREHHKLQRRDRHVITTVTVADMIMKPVLVIDEPSGEAMSLSIHCETAGPFVTLIHQLVEDAQGRLSSMKIFIEKLGKVCEALNIIVTVVKPLGDAHPAVKAAASVATLLYERCKMLQECHVAATELMEDIASFLPFTEIPIERCKSSVTIQTAESLLEVFEQISRAIIDTSTATVLGLLLKDRLEEIKIYKERLRSLKEKFDWCVKTEIWKAVLRVETHTENSLLTLLRPVHSAFRNPERVCFEGSRKDTIQMIHDWSTTSSKLLWLHGPKGMGKSTIAHTISESLYEENRLAGCFFCDRKLDELHCPERIIPTIAYQLAKWHAGYRSKILDILHGHEELDIHIGLEPQIDILLKRPLTKLHAERTTQYLPPAHKPLIIVLDEVDACNDAESSRRSLFDIIIDVAVVVPWLKVCVISGTSEDIERRLRQTEFQQIDISNASLDLRHDIAAYAKLCTDHARSSMKRNTRFGRDVRGLLSRLATSLESINGIGKADDINDLDLLDIDGFFRQLIQHIVGREGCDDVKRSIVPSILAIICCRTSSEPLSVNILPRLLWLYNPGIPEDVIRSTLPLLSPIISIDKAGFLCGLLPPSELTTFLSDRRRSGTFWVDVDTMREGRFRNCFKTMHAQLRFNICDLETSHARNEHIPCLQDRVRSGIPDLLRYYSLTWMDVIAQSGDQDASANAVIEILRSPKVLFWLEVLSLIGELKDALRILTDCMVYFKGLNDICETAKELHGFISSNYTAMELSTSHVYVSALAWLPAYSLLSNRVLRFVSSRPRIVFESLETKETIERMGSGKSGILRLACSIDGSRIVSGHDDGTLNIWDGRTGVLIHGPLSGHSSYVWSVAFSPVGSSMASGSFYGLRIWDALKLVASGPFESKSHVGALAFSPDGSRIVSGHKDGRIRIRDALSGDVIVESLMRHEEWVCAVAYSPDGNRIVTGSRDRTLRIWIWDANTATSIGRPLVGHTDSVMAVAYSPDGSKIVSGSFDKTVRIWDAQSGRQLGEPLEGHTTRVRDVGYSKDGSRILSSCYNEIRMWDANSDALVGVVPRGESRWDTERQCFVSIPSWWPRGQELKLQSLLLSANPLYIPDDGWIRTLDGGLLLWVPPEHRWCSCHTAQDSTITNDEHDERILNSEWRKLFHGKDWAKIMGVEGTEDG